METSERNGKIVVVVEDLLFLSKILETARRLSVPVQSAGPDDLQKELDGVRPRAVILDLNHRSGDAIEMLRVMKSNQATRDIRVVGFLSHVQSGLAQEAREAGCDQILARSAFSQRLPEILRELNSAE